LNPALSQKKRSEEPKVIWFKKIKEKEARIAVEDIISNPYKSKDLEKKIETLKEMMDNPSRRPPYVVVFPSEEPGKYEVLEGEEEVEAARESGIGKLPCIIKEMSTLEGRDLKKYKQLLKILAERGPPAPEKRRRKRKIFHLPPPKIVKKANSSKT